MNQLCSCLQCLFSSRNEEEKLQRSQQVNQIDGERQQVLNQFENCNLVDDNGQLYFNFKNDIYNIDQLIGEGAFSKVYKLSRKSDKQLSVLKMLTDNSSVNEFLREYNILKQLQSSNIIELYDCLTILTIEGKYLCFMMEYADQGSLQEFLDNPYKFGGQINPKQILQIAQSIFQGLQYLQEKKILHRDLKPDNILLSNFQAKIADVGLSKFLMSKQVNTKNVGNILYAAPEKNRQEDYGLSSDIYSAGLIILQLFFKLTHKEILKITMLQNKEEIDRAPTILKEFIEKLIQKSYKDRPTCLEVIKEIESFKKNQEVLQFIEAKYGFSNTGYYQDKYQTLQTQPSDITQQNQTISPIKDDKNITIFEGQKNDNRQQLLQPLINQYDVENNIQYKDLKKQNQSSTFNEKQSQYQFIQKQEVEEKLNILVIGGSGVGKTSVINNYCGIIQKNSGETTIGINRLRKKETIKGINVNIGLIDTPGQNIFRDGINRLFRQTDGIVLMYSHDQYRFQDIFYQINDIQEYAPSRAPIILIANKCDLEVHSQAFLQQQEQFDEQFGSNHIKTSAKTGYNVENAFKMISEQIIENKLESKKFLKSSSKNISLIKSPNKQKKNNKCC